MPKPWPSSLTEKKCPDLKKEVGSRSLSAPELLQKMWRSKGMTEHGYRITSVRRHCTSFCFLWYSSENNCATEFTFERHSDTASLIDSIRAEAGDGAGQCRDLSSCPHNGSGDRQWTAETKIKTVLYCTCIVLYFNHPVWLNISVRAVAIYNSAWKRPTARANFWL